MVIFLFLCAVVATVITIAVRDRRHARYTIFAEAARELGFVAASEGFLYSRIWLHGNQGGFRFHAEPYRVEEDGFKKERMGYRAMFPKPLEDLPTESGNLRRAVLERIDAAFIERRLDSDHLYCVRRSVPVAAEQLVEDARRVLLAAGALAGIPHGKEEPPRASRVPPPLPPPLPPPTPEAPEEITSQPGAGEGPSIPPLPDRSAGPTAGDGEARRVPTENEDAEEDRSAIGVKLPATDAGGEDGIEAGAASSTAGASRSGAPLAGRELPSDPDAAPREGSASALADLRSIALDLFAAGRNHYETGRRFDESYRSEAVAAPARLRGAEPYSHHRVFGRGPGLLATMELRAAPGAGAVAEGETAPCSPVTLVAEVSAGDEALAETAAWRRRAGEEFLVVGRLVRCDPFSRTLYLQEALCEERASALEVAGQGLRMNRGDNYGN